jgi:rubrerythrin
MMSQIPFDADKIKKEDINKEIVRTGIIAELDAINLYEQLASMTDRDDLKKVFADIAKEEKTHVGEFEALLLELDQEQTKEMEKGKDEVDELTK